MKSYLGLGVQSRTSLRVVGTPTQIVFLFILSYSSVRILPSHPSVRILPSRLSVRIRVLPSGGLSPAMSCPQSMPVCRLGADHLTFEGGGGIYCWQGIFFWNRYVQDFFPYPITMYDFFCHSFSQHFFFQ